MESLNSLHLGFDDALFFAEQKICISTPNASKANVYSSAVNISLEQSKIFISYFLLDLPNEILVMIFDQVDLKTQLTLKKVCKTFSKFDVTNLWDTGGLIKSKEITINLLHKFPKIKYLNLYDNKFIRDINFLQNVCVLNIGGFCVVSDEGIKNLKNLTHLHAENNYRIKNISNKNKLVYLNASGSCGICDEDIKNLNLKILESSLNNKIKKPNNYC
ncbi:hypothetical protein QJ857_gp0432 [Tupanvirus soda lake]|uniref:F-box domain-containing protein n=2 Tax=Tupanvirus TaxID=2094720 RepID=A0A6N1NWK6_9VIRU|nr:hypothetical protein QJ857_gp0432 [Tupanvirus soda lake]QKU35603.1 hypothetical protein [Tupanvirus soda lake]